MRMRSGYVVSAFLLLFLLGPATLMADTVNGSGGGWQNWSPSNLVGGTAPTPGSPYWNNASGDGSKADVGWCLVGGGNCSLSNGTPGYAPYFGVAGGLAASDMYFTSSGAGPVGASLLATITNATTVSNGFDVFGYYRANASGAPIAGSLTPMFNLLSNSAGSAFVLPALSAGQNYGFYIENIQGWGSGNETDYFFYMDSAFNSATGSLPADSLQHFGVFNGGSGGFYIGAKDSDACQGSFTPLNSPCVPSSQFDYNDVVISLVPVPEPRSLALLGAGLLSLGLLALRKRA